MNTVLLAEELCKSYYLHEQEREMPASLGISFTVDFGNLTALAGPSGAGKTTILKCVYRTCLLTSGRLLFSLAGGEEFDLCRASDHEVLKIRRDGEMAFVTQFLFFLPRKSAMEVVGQPLIEAGVSREEALERAAEQLDRFGLPKRLWELSPATFSGGERQRVNLARGFVQNPRLLLLDEPTASLDPISAERTVVNIERAKESGTAILAVFHSKEMVGRLADQKVTVTQT